MTIVPLPVVVVERPIPLTAECVTAPVISDSHVVSTVKRGVLCAVDRDISIPIDRHIIAIAKLIRVTKPINIRILSAVEVSLAIDRYVVATSKFVRVAITINIRVRCAVDRNIRIAIHHNVSVAIHRNITSRTKFLFPLGVPLTHPFVPGEVSLADCS